MLLKDSLHNMGGGDWTGANCMLTPGKAGLSIKREPPALTDIVTREHAVACDSQFGLC